MPRTLTIRYPNGTIEYWFTELVFEAGDKLERSGMSWIVAHVSDPNEVGKHLTVTVLQDGSTAPT